MHIKTHTHHTDRQRKKERDEMNENFNDRILSDLFFFPKPVSMHIFSKVKGFLVQGKEIEV